MENKIYSVLRKHKLPLKKREELIKDLLPLFNINNIYGSAGLRYPMFKDQAAQIDCRNTKCKFYIGAGNCTNVSPAITLNENKTFVCWSNQTK